VSFASTQRQLAALREAVRRLQPKSAPGVLTSRTTGGVTRRPTVKSSTTRTTGAGGAVVVFL
jgi:hypothetical protein